jgi:D-glycero-D-manno-heptose 1,7-bisphosphate phosphatase
VTGAPVAAFLDRDGVLIDTPVDVTSGLPESAYVPEDVRLLPGVPAALRRLRELGLLLVVASNQPAAAKGTRTLEALHAVHERTVELLAAEGLELDDWRYCFHHPAGSDPVLGRPCDCRKPAPGLLLDAADDLGIDLGSSWMIGDSSSDVTAGRAAGTRTILVEHPGSAHRRTTPARPTATVLDLPLAVDVIEGYGARARGAGGAPDSPGRTR